MGVTAMLPEISDSGTAALQLLLLIPLGITTYTLTLLASWFAFGRPDGAEMRALEMAVDRRVLNKHWAYRLSGNQTLFGDAP